MGISRYKKVTETQKNKLTTGNDVSGIKGIIAEFKHYVEESLKGEKVFHSKSRAYELHPSSFPYCGLRHWYEIMKEGGVNEYQKLDFYGHFYVSNGTVTHEVIQEWLGRNKKIVGDWKCEDRTCSGKREFSTYKKCPVCKKEMRYEELGIEFGEYTKGHIDGVFLIKRGGKYYIVDYKTCGVKDLNAHKSGTQKIFPYAYNIPQIESYCFYLEQEKKIKIGGWLLVYVSRDSAFRNYEVVGKTFTEKYRRKVKAKCEKSDKHFGIAIKERKLKNVKTLIKEKPCDCERTYYAEYHNKYSPCPLKEVCFNRIDLIRELKVAQKTYDKKVQV